MIGRILGHYRVGEQLGKGGMREVRPSIERLFMDATKGQDRRTKA